MREQNGKFIPPDARYNVIFSEAGATLPFFTARPNPLSVQVINNNLIC